MVAVLFIVILLGSFILGRAEFIALIFNHHLIEFAFGLLVGHLLRGRLDHVDGGGLVLLCTCKNRQRSSVVEFVVVIKGYLMGVVSDMSWTASTAYLSVRVDVVVAALIKIEVGRVSNPICMQD